MHLDSQKRRSFLARLFAIGDFQRYAIEIFIRNSSDTADNLTRLYPETFFSK